MSRIQPAGIKQLLATYWEAMLDAHWTISEQIADGDTVVTCFVDSGTQRGSLWGVPVTTENLPITVSQDGGTCLGHLSLSPLSVPEPPVS